MTDKQKIFCDEYLIDANASRAYKAAYPRVKSDDVARAAASRLLTNVNVRDYIEKQMEKINSEKIADAEEVIKYLTAVMRREKKEHVVVTLTQERTEYVPDEKGTPRKQTVKEEKAEAVEIPAKLSDANKAAELLGKRYGLFTEKMSLEVEPVEIVDDLKE